MLNLYLIKLRFVQEIRETFLNKIDIVLHLIVQVYMLLLIQTKDVLQLIYHKEYDQTMAKTEIAE